MTYRRIHIHLHSDGYRLTTHGVDVHQVRNLVKLAGRCPEKLRAYIATATGIVPDVTRARGVSEPPSGILTNE